jgi:molybdenum cofactor cytidylyltransferase
LDTDTGIIILAAGSSSRMGSSKQLLPINNEPLLIHTIKQAVLTSRNVVVVLGSGFEQHFDLVKPMNVSTVRNIAWEKGMGTSIKEGLHFLINNIRTSRNALFMTCDQPYVDSDYLKKIIQQANHKTGHIIASTYNGTVGIPALFPYSYFNDLLNLNDDEGAKKVIQKNFIDVVMVDFPEGAVDLDTPDEYKQFLRKNQTDSHRA